ncbi:sensor histidine kinase [Tengunoibacter tsumagoiensis]|nr:ATP-binding protein [Tengunoibacter tsumagoiensis]
MKIRERRADLTHTQQEAEALDGQLQEIQERLQLVQQAANVGIFEWDMRTRIITWTKEAEALFGLQPGSFGGDFASWEKTVHPDDLSEACTKVFESVTQKTRLDVQFRTIWPDGSIHWIYTKARTFYDTQGNPLRMLGINIDITERKNDEEQLRLSREQLRLFAESDIVGVFIADIYGTIYHANDAFLQIVGYSRTELCEGKIRWTNMTPPEWLPFDQEKLRQAQQAETPMIYEKQYLRRDGRIIDVLVGYLLVGERREQAIAFALDVTERKQVERQKDEFLGVVSHELRTPVTSLKVFVQTVQKRLKKSGDDENAELLGKMGAQIDRLARLIAELIDITKLETGKLQLSALQFDLSSLIDEVIEEMQRTTTHHSIRKEGILSISAWGDRDRIGQVLINLLSNAIKYSPLADSICVKMEADSEQVTVSVQDFGLGIPQEQQEQIFQRFYRVEEKDRETISGLGLGLYIAAEIIKRHGGKIWFKSTPGEGSTFFFSLPLQRYPSLMEEMEGA